VVVKASEKNDLDNAVAIVQKEAGISTGDVAGVFFSDAFDDTGDWVSLTSLQRISLLKKYLNHERSLVKLMVMPAVRESETKDKHYRLFQVRYIGNQNHEVDGDFDLTSPRAEARGFQGPLQPKG
jgi:hypothetical protein